MLRPHLDRVGGALFQTGACCVQHRGSLTSLGEPDVTGEPDPTAGAHTRCLRVVREGQSACAGTVSGVRLPCFRVWSADFVLCF